MKMGEADNRGRFWRRAGAVALQLLLVAVILGLIAAMWLPAHIGVSTEKTGHDDFGFPRSRQAK